MVPMLWEAGLAVIRLSEIYEKVQSASAFRVPDRDRQQRVVSITQGEIRRHMAEVLGARLARRAGHGKRATNYQVRCRGCGAWTRDMVIVPGGGWGCMGCYAEFPKDLWLLIAQVAFATRIGVHGFRAGWLRRQLFQQVIALGARARTVEDVMQVAMGGAVLAYPTRFRGVLPARAFHQHGIPGTQKRPRSAFWGMLRPYYLDAYVDSFLSPEAYRDRFGG